MRSVAVPVAVALVLVLALVVFLIFSKTDETCFIQSSSETRAPHKGDRKLAPETSKLGPH
jgi:hypothetical protein